MIKPCVKSGLITVLFCISTSILADFEVDTMKLKKITPRGIYFTGKVQPFQSVLLAFNISGIVKETKSIGTPVYSEIKTTDGKIIRPGTVVAELYPQEQIFAVKSAELKLKIAEANYNNALKTYERQAKLITKKVVAQADFQNTTTTLMKAQLELRTAKNNLATAEYNLECTKVKAPFDAIVSEIIRGKNRGVGSGDDIVQITRIDPVMIKIPFNKTIRHLISKETQILVYPNYSNKPVPAWLESDPRDNLNAEVFVVNDLEVFNLTSEEKKLPKVYQLMPITKLAQEGVPKKYEDIICVPIKAIHHDEKGDYVLKAAGQIALDPQEPISKTFKIERVNIVKGDIKTRYNLGYKGLIDLISIKTNEDLKDLELVVIESDPNIKVGDTVAYAEKGWLFNPNDIIPVEIPSLTKPGIYVHHNCIIFMGIGRNYVYLNNKGKAKLVKVKVTGTIGQYFSIEGKGITEDAEVLYFKTKEKAARCCNGLKIKVGKVKSPPLYLEEKHATPLYFPKQPIHQVYHL